MQVHECPVVLRHFPGIEEDPRERQTMLDVRTAAAPLETMVRRDLLHLQDDHNHHHQEQIGRI